MSVAVSFQKQLDINHNKDIPYTRTGEPFVVKHIVDTFERSVILMVDFMRSIPGFVRLNKSDQAELLKSMLFTCNKLIGVRILIIFNI